MRQKMPIGISDFEEIITKDYYYVDKSLLIDELLASGAKVTLVPRPRRFGKTLNMTMLRAFFEKSEQNKAHLFSHLAIAQHQEIMAKQGNYPVIFLTFKDVKSLDWDVCFGHLCTQIIDEYRRHRYLLTSGVLDADERIVYEQILVRSAPQPVYERGLKDLTVYLERYYKARAIVLIDEYDTPIHAGFLSGYYDQVINFMRGMLCGALKDNSSLEFAVMTGVLRVAKESIFSGLNNLKVCTFLSDHFADKFGLTQQEVSIFLADFGLEDETDAVRQWYDGYTSGSIHVYNPWSIIGFVDNRGVLQPYWVNTSSNDLIQHVIQNGDADLKGDLALLMEGQPIRRRIDENIVFQQVYTNPNALWNFLLLSGYLTYANLKLEGVHQYADFVIPNDEVLSLYESIIMTWFESSLGVRSYHRMLMTLVTGDVAVFKKVFRDFVRDSLSYFDVGGNEPERFYHAFVLGMLVSLKESHQITSNRESGYGRHDVMLVPLDKIKPGIVIEFKRVEHDENETLDLAADRALEQIGQRAYASALHAQGIKEVICLGIAFDGKQILIKERREQAA